MNKKTSFFTACVTYFLTFSLVCQANPQKPAVVEGQAAFKTQGKELHIKSSDRAIIDWKSFSIKKGEITKFIQDSESSAILNRVTSKNSSALLGMLESNGKVYLINPNGVVIGEKALINTNGFVGSTLDLDNELFIQNGDLIFQGDSNAAVINYGTINAWDGDVILLGRVVENHGELNALQGTVGMGSGQEILLSVDGDERIFIKPSSAENTLKRSTGILNKGALKAIQAELKAEGNPFAYAIKHDGSIEAKGAVRKNGRIFLKADKGEVFVSGKMQAQHPDQIGGEIQILGERVGIWEGANIDASGEFGGGKVLIGGDFQGKNPQILNASVTVVDQGATIDVSARQKGDAGTAIVWADKGLQFSGKIMGHGGVSEGHGGFVEVSGKEQLQFFGTVDLQANNGKTGDLFLDPQGVEITPIGGYLTPCTPDEASLLAFEKSIGNVSLLKGTMLSSTLEKCNVVLQANTDIKILDKVPRPEANANSLTLQAGRSIIFQKDSSVSLNGGDFIATINDPEALARDRLPGNAVFKMMSGAKLNTHNGHVKIKSGNFSGSSSGSMRLAETGATINSGTGFIDINMVNRSSEGNAISLDPGTSLVTLGTGNISLHGTAEKAVGVAINQAKISTQQGDLSISGHSSNSHGIVLSEGIALTESGTISLKGSSVEAASKGVVLQSSTSPVLQSTNGNIYVHSNHHVSHEGAGSLATGGNGSIVVTATEGTIQMQPSTKYIAEASSINLDAAQVVLGEIKADNIVIQAKTGTISANESSNVNLTGNQVALLAKAEIGSAEAPIKGSINTLQAISGEEGSIHFANNEKDLDLKAWNVLGNSVQAAKGSVNIQNTTHSITFVDPVVSGSDIIVNSGASIQNMNPSVVLAAGQLYLNAAMGIGSSETPIITHVDNLQVEVSNKGDVHITNEGSDLNLVAWNKEGNSVQTNEGTINIQDTTHSVVVHNPVVTHEGDANIAAAHDVILSEVVVDKGNVIVTATEGTIQSSNDKNSTNISADKAYLSAGKDIGGKDTQKTISTSVDTLQTIVKGKGDIKIKNDRTVTLEAWKEPGDSVQTSKGKVDIVSKGNLGVKSPVKTDPEGYVKLTAEKGTILQTENVLAENDELYFLDDEVFEQIHLFSKKKVWFKTHKFVPPSVIERAGVTSAYLQKYYLYTYKPYQIFPDMIYIVDNGECFSNCCRE